MQGNSFRYQWFLFPFLLLVLIFFPFSVLEAAQTGQPVLRTVLVLFSGQGLRADKNEFWNDWNFPLNYLGFKARYWNLNKEPPPTGDLGSYRAIVMVLSGEKGDPAVLWSFLDRVTKEKKRLLILGDLPSHENDGPAKEIERRTLGRMGLRREGRWVRQGLRYAVLNRKMVAFEEPPPPLPPVFRPLTSLDPKNRVWIGVRSDAHGNRGIVSTFVVTGSFGGIALDPFLTRDSPLSPEQQGWIINPFRFLEESLNGRSTPRMDLTSINGNRIFYSQIDGDGFETLSRYREGQMCGQVFYHEILKRYPLPFTASIITSQVDPQYEGSAQRVRWAKRIYSLPNVEAGSHTFSHPFYWVPTAVQRAEGPVHIHVPGYHFNLHQEINGSLDWMNRFVMPPGKKVMLFQWSGNTRPGEDALRLVYDYPVLNLNGSDSRLDKKHPSYLNVFPYYRQVGPYVQYFNSDANEFILTDDWKGPFFAYENIIQTFQKTERPRQVDPINVYLHFYSGQKEASIRAVRDVLDWVLTQRLTPMFSSDFVRVEKGFIAARIQEGVSGKKTYWTISRFGRDTTVRFDHAQHLFPDLKRSSAVIGYRHKNGSLYLYLAPGDRATIFLSHRKPSVPVIRSATGYVSMTRSQDSFAIVYHGWEAGSSLVIGNLPPGIRMRRSPCPSGDHCTLRSGSSGNLRVRNLKSDIPITIEAVR